MGGADFVQWHGNYELLLHEREVEAAGRELRREGPRRPRRLRTALRRPRLPAALRRRADRQGPTARSSSSCSRPRTWRS